MQVCFDQKSNFTRDCLGWLSSSRKNTSPVLSLSLSFTIKFSGWETSSPLSETGLLLDIVSVNNFFSKIIFYEKMGMRNDFLCSCHIQIECCKTYRNTKTRKNLIFVFLLMQKVTMFLYWNTKTKQFLVFVSNSL